MTLIDFVFEVDALFERSNSRRSSVKLDNVDFTPNIPQPRYVTQESPPTSPTPSQMLPDELNQLMIIDSVEPFQIDKDLAKSCIFQNMTKIENGFSLPNLPLKLDMSLGKNGISVRKEIG